MRTVEQLEALLAVNQRRLDYLEPMAQALDGMLVASFLGTLESFPSFYHAIKALVDFDSAVEKYMSGERIKELEGLLSGTVTSAQRRKEKDKDALQSRNDILEEAVSIAAKLLRGNTSEEAIEFNRMIYRRIEAPDV